LAREISVFKLAVSPHVHKLLLHGKPISFCR